jgi:hypothetical protein
MSRLPNEHPIGTKNESSISRSRVLEKEEAASEDHQVRRIAEVLDLS